MNWTTPLPSSQLSLKITLRGANEFKNHFKRGETNFTSLFFANSPAAVQDAKNFEERFNAAINEIESSGNLNKKNDKKIKYI